MTDQDVNQFGLPSLGIPGEILFNPFISPNTKLLFGFIRNLSKSSRGCWCSNSIFGEYINCTPQVVSSMISKLQKFGYINIKRIQKRDKSIERQIFESNNYQEIYKPVVNAFHDYPNLNTDLKMIEYLGIKIYKILPDLFEIQQFKKDQNETVLRLTLRGDKDSLKLNILERDIERDRLYSKEYRSVSDETLSNKNSNSPSKIKRTRNIPIEDPPEIKNKKEHISNGWKSIALDTWNNLNGPSIHYDRTTKIVKRISDLLGYLESGMFFDKCQIKHEFCEKNKIPLKKLWQSRTKINQAKIIRTISSYQSLWKEGFWPTDKKHLPKSLDTFLFNPMSGTSFFLMLIYNPDVLKPLSDKNSYKNKFIDHFEVLLSKIPDQNIDDIGRSLNRLSKWIDENFDKNHKVFDHYLGTHEKFFEYYADWLNECEWRYDWLAENYKHVFNDWGCVFKEFLNHIRCKWNIGLIGD